MNCSSFTSLDFAVSVIGPTMLTPDSIAKSMQTSQYHTLIAQRFTLPKTMRIGSAAAPNGIALTPT